MLKFKRQWISKFLLISCLILPVSAFAQNQTTVTGTVTDPNGIPYSYGTIRAQLTAPAATVTLNNAAACAQGGFGSAPCQVPIQGSWGPAQLDVNGTFTMSLYPNSDISPAGSQYVFTVQLSPGVLPPFGKGQQSFSVTQTISGASQSLTTVLNAAAPALTVPIAGSGSGVSTVSIQNVPPLLTCSVSTPTTTPDISCALNNAAANTVFGNCGSSIGAPSYCSITQAMLPAGTITGTFSTNQVLFGSAANVAAGSNNFQFSAGTGVAVTAPADNVSALSLSMHSTTQTSSVFTITIPNQLVADFPPVFFINQAAPNGSGMSFTIDNSGLGYITFLNGNSMGYATIGNSVTGGMLLFADGNIFDFTPGVQSPTVLRLNGITSGSASIAVGLVAGTPQMLCLPTTTAGGTGYFLASTPSSGSCNSGSGQQLSWVPPGGTGTVTSIATTLPIVGGTITTAGNISCPTCDTSAASLTNNAVVIGQGGQAVATIGADTTTTHFLAATAGAPAFRGIAAGDIPTLNQNTTGTAGGLTGCSPSTAGSICYWNGSAWTLLAGNNSGTNVLTENSSGVPSWAAGGGISGLTTGFMTKAGSSTSIVNSLCDEGITTANVLTCTDSAGAVFTALVSVAADGVHPGNVKLVGNTTVVTPAANTFDLMGPSSATFTAYALQFSATGPSAAGVMHSGAPSSAVSQITFSPVSLTADVSGILPIANGGTGTASPALVAGTNISITGSWPNQTINSSGGGSGAPGGVTILTKTATYAGASGDFSSSTAAPTQVIFTLTAVAQTYTLLSTAPGTGACVILENSLASAPFPLGLVTGGSTTLDGVAYTTAATTLKLAPGESVHVCSDGTNYHAQNGRGETFVTTVGVSGVIIPEGYPTCCSNGVSTGANTSQVGMFQLHETVLVTNITGFIQLGVVAATCDWGIYDSSGNLVTHTGSDACTTAQSTSQVTKAASPTIVLSPGTYYAAFCSSSATVSFGGFSLSSNGTQVLQSGQAHTIGTGATACTAGVLPATLGTVTNSTGLNVIPIMALTP